MHPNGQTGSLYGQTILDFVADFSQHTASAYETARYLVTHGYRYPERLAVASLGFFDRAAFDVLQRFHAVSIANALLPSNVTPALTMYVNSLGRLHIRRADEGKVTYHT